MPMVVVLDAEERRIAKIQRRGQFLTFERLDLLAEWSSSLSPSGYVRELPQSRPGTEPVEAIAVATQGGEWNKCSAEPAPPLATTGIPTALETARVIGKS